MKGRADNLGLQGYTHTIDQASTNARLGLRAWATAARGKVNVHISIEQEMTPWHKVSERISSEGISSVVSAVNRKRIEEVYDPAI